MWLLTLSVWGLSRGSSGSELAQPASSGFSGLRFHVCEDREKTEAAGKAGMRLCLKIASMSVAQKSRKGHWGSWQEFSLGLIGFLSMSYFLR